MAMPRTPLKLLTLQGSGNIKRHLDREKLDAENAPATIDRSEEIAALDALIAKTLKACAKGSTKNRKANPAFSHLAILVRLRTELLVGSKPGKESQADTLAEIDAALGAK
jgi:hypothetical protein